MILLQFIRQKKIHRILLQFIKLIKCVQNKCQAYKMYTEQMSKYIGFYSRFVWQSQEKDFEAG